MDQSQKNSPRAFAVLEIGPLLSGFAYNSTTASQASIADVPIDVASFFTKWLHTRSGTEYCKTYSAVFYSVTDKKTHFGWEAEQMRDTQPHQPWQFHTNFSFDDIKDVEHVESSDQKTKEDALTDFVSWISDKAFQSLKSSLHSDIEKSQIQWAFVIPSNSTQRTRSNIERLCSSIDILNSRAFPPKIFHQSDSVALFGLKMVSGSSIENERRLKSDSPVMLVDCGAKNTVISLYKWNSSQLEEIATPVYFTGSHIIDEEFFKWLRSQKYEEWLQERKQRGASGNPLLNAWHRSKWQFRGNEANPIEVSLSKAFQSIEVAQFSSFFEPYLRSVVQNILEVLKRFPQCKNILLTGGTSASLHVRSYLESKVGVSCFPVHRSSEASLSGAMMQLLAPSFTPNRKISKVIGVGIGKQGGDVASFTTVMDPYLKVGEIIPTSHVVRKLYRLAFPDQNIAVKLLVANSTGGHDILGSVLIRLVRMNQDAQKGVYISLHVGSIGVDLSIIDRASNRVLGFQQFPLVF